MEKLIHTATLRGSTTEKDDTIKKNRKSGRSTGTAQKQAGPLKSCAGVVIFREGNEPGACLHGSGDCPRTSVTRFREGNEPGHAAWFWKVYEKKTKKEELS
ncbi:MAG: hypothetical protein MJ117_00880 [Lachnospiraceae bacterium]|nr:hypothetical protein [Lachnospiraceae bacterium]